MSERAAAERRVLVEASATWAALAAQLVAQALCRRLEVAERVSLFLAGGSTPRPVYRRLARTALAWGRIDFYWGDERCVEPESEASNYRMASRALLEPLGIIEASIARIPGELGAEAAARSYEEVLADRFEIPSDDPNETGSEAQRPDVVLLGLGEDGHTASLVPGAPLDPAEGRRVMAARSPQPPHDRVSLGGSFLASAGEVVFLVTGAAKASRVAAVLAGEDDGPAAAIDRRARRVTWILDAEAAGELAERW